MAHEVEEMTDMVNIASALVINIGTLSKRWIEAMLLAGQRAHERGIPIILDPVGAGASALRTTTANEIITRCHPTIIRGNASEIMALVNSQVKTKGVDSTATTHAALDAAKTLATATGAIISVSGATDIITDGTSVHEITNGHPMMPRVTGMGCTATALTGAFAAIHPNALEAATATMAIMGITGEIAAAKAQGPASLQLQFIDTLYNITAEDIMQHIK
jgi:hydroxyethylthiazole kinase